MPKRAAVVANAVSGRARELVCRSGIKPDPRDADTSVSLLGLQGWLELDIRSGRASIVKNGRSVLAAVNRKSLPDLVGSTTGGRL